MNHSVSFFYRVIFYRVVAERGIGSILCCLLAMPRRSQELNGGRSRLDQGLRMRSDADCLTFPSPELTMMNVGPRSLFPSWRRLQPRPVLPRLVSPRLVHPRLVHPRLLLGAIAALIGIASWGTPQPVQAAEKIVLKYGILREDFSVADITQFAKTGQSSPPLQLLLKLAERDPQQVRTALTQEFKVNHRLLDLALNSDPGEAALDRVGELIRTPAGKADRQAIRAALVLAASDDGKLSLLEVIQKYPTQEVRIEGDRLVPAYQQLSKLEQKARQVVDILTSW